MKKKKTRKWEQVQKNERKREFDNPVMREREREREQIIEFVQSDGTGNQEKDNRKNVLYVKKMREEERKEKNQRERFQIRIEREREREREREIKKVYKGDCYRKKENKMRIDGI